jgi:hypothetical protein
MRNKVQQCFTARGWRDKSARVLCCLSMLGWQLGVMHVTHVSLSYHSDDSSLGLGKLRSCCSQAHFWPRYANATATVSVRLRWRAARRCERSAAPPRE